MRLTRLYSLSLPTALTQFNRVVAESEKVLLFPVHKVDHLGIVVVGPWRTEAEQFLAFVFGHRCSNRWKIGKGGFGQRQRRSNWRQIAQ